MILPEQVCPFCPLKIWHRDASSTERLLSPSHLLLLWNQLTLAESGLGGSLVQKWKSNYNLGHLTKISKSENCLCFCDWYSTPQIGSLETDLYQGSKSVPVLALYIISCRSPASNSVSNKVCGGGASDAKGFVVLVYLITMKSKNLE